MKKTLSKEMINTLLGITRGDLYTLRGDRSVGLENTRDKTNKKNKEKNCRSLAPLMRMGFIAFVDSASDPSRFYRVRITESGTLTLQLSCGMNTFLFSL